MNGMIPARILCSLGLSINNKSCPFRLRRSSVPLSFSSQGIVGRVNAYYSYNAAIDAAADALEVKEQEQKASFAAAPVAGDDGRGDDRPRPRFPPIEQAPGVGGRPRSATRPISAGRLSRIEGWHLGHA